MKLKNLFASDSSSPEEEEFCCGKHAVCLKNKQVRPVKTPLSSPIEYYDDEELDVFKDRPSTAYTVEEVEQFAEVFRTMSAGDVPGWLAGLRLRNIELPHSLKLIIHNS